ncbi:MAG: hypothetical protein RLY95_1562 [Pseudomonadota bacterium]|jgi:hypothetical protein
MLKTYFIDGDKGGVGKSVATRALVHHFLQKPSDERPKIVVYDADLSNPDVCGEGGLKAGEGILATALIDLSTENGWIDFAGHVAKISHLAQQADCRIIVNMPAQIGTRAFDGSIPIVNEVMREANAIPIWLLSRTEESIRALNYRIQNMPARYASGLVVKNLFFGAADKFLLWDKNELRQDLVQNSSWLETTLPELNDQLTVMIGRRPYHEVLLKGIDGRQLDLGYRLTLKAWLEKAARAMAVVDQLTEEDFQS